MGLFDIARKVLGKEAADEYGIEIDASDGCVGEEFIAKIINKLKPC